MTVNDKKEFIVNCAYFALVAAILYFVLKYAAGWFLPFIIGLCFAAVSNKLAARIVGKKHTPHRAIPMIIALLILLLIAGAATAVVILLSRQIGAFVQQYLIDGNLLSNAQKSLEILLAKLPGEFGDKLVGAADGLISSLAAKIPSVVGGFVSKTPSFLLTTIVSIIASFFITAEYRKVTEFLKGLVPKRYRYLSDAVSETMRSSVLRFLRAYGLIMCITFVEVSVGLTLFGQKYAIGIAAITAIIDILPVFGLGFVLWPWAAYSFIVGDYRLAICLLVLYAVVQIVRQFIEPKLVGRSIGMHPLLTLVSMYVGVRVFGAVGLFALPILVLILKNLNDNGTISVFRSAVKKEDKI